MAKIDKEILNDIHIGNATILLKDYDADDWRTVSSDGEVTYKTNGLDFTNADAIVTAKGTLEINQGEPSITELKLDQNDETYASIAEKGDFTFGGLIPSVAEAVFDKFLNKTTENGDAEYSVKTGDETFTGKGYESSIKKIEVSVLIKSQSGNSVIVFSKVDLYGAFTGASTDAGAGVRMVGTVVANPNGPDLLVLKKPAA